MKRKVCIVIDEKLLTKVREKGFSLSKLINNLLLDYFNNNNTGKTVDEIKKEIEILKTRIEDLENKVFVNS